MAAASPAALARIARSGMGVIAPAAGLAALGRTLAAWAPAAAAAAPPAVLVASPFQWARLLRGAPGAPPGMFGEVAPAAAAQPAVDAGPAERRPAGPAPGPAAGGSPEAAAPAQAASLAAVLQGTGETVRALLSDQVPPTSRGLHGSRHI